MVAGEVISQTNNAHTVCKNEQITSALASSSVCLGYNGPRAIRITAAPHDWRAVQLIVQFKTGS